MRRTAVSAVVLAAVLGAALVGCSRTSACIDYISFGNDPAAMAEASRLVVTGRQTPTTETFDLSGALVAVHEIEVERVLKGDVATDTITAVAPAGNCFDVGSTIDDDGILNVDGNAEFFLIWNRDHWVTLTPFDGVVPVPATGELPWDPAVDELAE
jgi:hypothetical protein